MKRTCILTSSLMTRFYQRYDVCMISALWQKLWVGLRCMAGRQGGRGLGTRNWNYKQGITQAIENKHQAIPDPSLAEGAATRTSASSTCSDLRRTQHATRNPLRFAFARCAAGAGVYPGRSQQLAAPAPSNKQGARPALAVQGAPATMGSLFYNLYNQRQNYRIGVDKKREHRPGLVANSVRLDLIDIAPRTLCTCRPECDCTPPWWIPLPR